MSGFLTSEAETSSICVEAGPDNPSRFQDHFKKNSGCEPDHYVGHVVAGYGGLTHNTLNVVNRNIRYGMPGCACEPKPAAVAAECKCTAKRMLEENKNGGLVYSMEKLREHDLDWFVYIEAGAVWEILSSDMDTEEPTAAHIIALAYNDKNKVAMATGHLEMMRYLQSLCTPDPSTELHWDAILLSMQKRFGKHNMADTANYHHAYKLMVVSGGSDSLTWKDFFRWAAIFCDESKTQIKLDTYSVLASYPIEFRHIAKMQMKQTWHQKPKKKGESVPVPPNIGIRLQEEGRDGAWPQLMKEVEVVGHELHNFCSAVAEQNKVFTDDERRKFVVRWCGQVEVTMMNKISVVPKVEVSKLEEQEAAVRTALAEVIGDKLVELLRVSNIQGPFLNVINPDFGGTLMEEAMTLFKNPEWRKEREAQQGGNPAAGSKDAQPELKTKVIVWNEKMSRRQNWRQSKTQFEKHPKLKTLIGLTG